MLKSRLRCWRGILLAGALALALPQPAQGCTIVLLTDESGTLFFNNEDWSNPKTRLWFSPAGQGHFGCAFVGFDDGFAQGGLNTEGLAFDCVASLNPNSYQPDPSLKPTRGSSSERMLESCATVEEAIAFYQKYREPDFARARMMVADKTGASVIIGSRDGKLFFERSRQSRGFGYGGETVKKMLAAQPRVEVSQGLSILRACKQEGPYATKYSNAFDLRSGEIHLFLPSDKTPRASINLADALEKGGRYYDIPEIRRQMAEPPLPLPNDLQRFFLDRFKPLSEQEPAVKQRVRRVLEGWARGTLLRQEFSGAFGNQLESSLKQSSSDLERFGALVSLTLLGNEQVSAGARRQYRVNFENAAVLMEFQFDPDSKISGAQTKGVEWAAPVFFKD